MTGLNEQTCWRIVEIKNGRPHTLFHGMDAEKIYLRPRIRGRITNGRSREIVTDRWIKAERKPVRDGSGEAYYGAGFNVLASEEQARAYLSRFKNLRDLRVVPVLTRGELRDKPTNPEVKLADWMFLEDGIWQTGWERHVEGQA